MGGSASPLRRRVEALCAGLFPGVELRATAPARAPERLPAAAPGAVAAPRDAEEVYLSLREDIGYIQQNASEAMKL